MVAEVIILAKLPSKTKYFDYIVSEADQIQVGQIVKVNFRNKFHLALVANLKKSSQLLNLKSLQPYQPIIILPQWHLDFINWFAQNYWVSPGLVAKTFLPELYNKKGLNYLPTKITDSFSSIKVNNSLVYCPTFVQREQYYLKQLQDNTGTILVVVPTNFEAQKIENLALNYYQSEQVINLSRETRLNKVSRWLQILQNKPQLIIACRSDILAPVNNLTKIIIDLPEDENHYQKEPQPRYNVVDCLEYISQRLNCPLIKLSFQPPVTEIYKYQQGQQKLQKITNQTLAKIETIEINSLSDRRYHLKNLINQYDQIAIFINFSNQYPSILKEIKNLDLNKKVHFNDPRLSTASKILNSSVCIFNLGQKRLLNLKKFQAIIWLEPNGLNLLGDYSLTEKIKQNLAYFQASQLPVYLIDKLNESNPLLLNWLEFAQHELQIRQKFNYPPYCQFSRLIFKSQSSANEFRQLVQNHLKIKIDSSYKLKGKSGSYLFIKYQNTKDLEQILQLRPDCILDKTPQSVLY